MKRTKLIIITAILSVILLVAQIYIVKVASEYEPKKEVLFAKEYIPANTVITEEMLEKKRINLSLIHEKSIFNTDALIGRKAKIDIEKGEMILESKLISEEDEAEKILVKNENSRLFTLELKGDQANGWQIKPDQYVDILFIPAQKQEERIVERIEKVRVAALISDDGKLIKDKDENILPRYICLEVDTEIDELLAYAKGNGRIELSVIPEK